MFFKHYDTGKCALMVLKTVQGLKRQAQGLLKAPRGPGIGLSHIQRAVLREAVLSAMPTHPARAKCSVFPERSWKARISVDNHDHQH